MMKKRIAVRGAAGGCFPGPEPDRRLREGRNAVFRAAVLHWGCYRLQRIGRRHVGGHPRANDRLGQADNDHNR